MESRHFSLFSVEMKRTNAFDNLEQFYYASSSPKKDQSLNLYLRKDQSDYSLDILPSFYAERDASWNNELNQYMDDNFHLCYQKKYFDIPKITLKIVHHLISLKQITFPKKTVPVRQFL